MIVDRRIFLTHGICALIVGKALESMRDSPDVAFAEEQVFVETLKFRITDAEKQMVTHNTINDARCYFWVFKEERFPAEVPGPVVVVTEGETVRVSVTNDLDEPHAFFIKNVVNSGPVQPGQTVNISFTAPAAGTYLYYDNLNAPVNRMMGLHGAIVVMPRITNARRATPYSRPTPQVQELFDDLGDSVLFPGLPWGIGDSKTGTPPFRQYVWVLHEASPKLFEEVGSLPRGQIYPAEKFRKAFTEDPFALTTETGKFNRKPHFFTIKWPVRTLFPPQSVHFPLEKSGGTCCH